jgi:hypothetical protein
MPNRWWKGSTLTILAIAAATSIGLTAERPSKLEPIPGSDLKRVVLTAKAAQRLDIRTVAVKEQQGQKWLVLEGRVDAAPEGGGRVQVVPVEDADRILADPRLLKANARLAASLRDAAEAEEDDADAGKSGDKTSQADPGQILVVPIGFAQAVRLAARPIQMAGGQGGSVQTYDVTTTDHRLVPGQRVYMRVPHPNRDKLYKAVPYSAIIYDRNGQTWVFTNPEPNVFVRARIDVDFIDGRRAYLKEGPALDTKVVTAGAAELMGVEQKFGQ